MIARKAVSFFTVMGAVAPVWAAEAPDTCSRISGAAESHTCGHGRSGPFESRVAVPYLATVPTSIPNIDPTHTLYTMLLSGESESQEWAVSYRPNVSGWYAIFLDVPGTEVIEEQPFPYELRDAFGEPVPVRLEHVVTRCPGYLAWVKVYDIDAARYHLVFGGNPNDNVQVAIEHVDVMGQYLFPDKDGDGFGAGTALASWCGEARGYSELQGDCDDEDPLVFPDEQELCAIPEEPCEESGDCPNGAAGAPGEASGGSSNHDNMGGDSGDAEGGMTGNGAANGSTGDDDFDDSDDGLGGSSDSDGPDDDSADGESNDEAGSGCSCRTGTKPNSAGAFGWVLALAGSILARRRLGHPRTR